MRCAACEREWREGARSRNAVKSMFAPAITILAGGAVFGALLPLVMGSFVGACAVAALTTAAGVSAGVGTARLVDGAARTQFRREKARALPEARARIVHHRALPPGRPG
ncbi:MAG: hypothetical protein K8W52_10020 [Deltaproteobacteria bacterium]|nr:hypothetical protein [Deltaproteobacteria bacterium]